MLMMIQFSPTLTLCKEWRGNRALEVGNLVPVYGGDLLMRITRIEDDLIHLFAPADCLNERSFLADGWRRYKPEKPLLMKWLCVEGGEDFAISWAMTRRVYEFPDGTHCPAKFLRGWRCDKYPGVVVCEFKRLHVAVCA